MYAKSPCVHRFTYFISNIWFAFDSVAFIQMLFDLFTIQHTYYSSVDMGPRVLSHEGAQTSS
jgi:hypothetical protein